MAPAEAVLVLGLATAALWRAWHAGGLFATLRARAEAWRGLKGRKRPLGLLGELLDCPTCSAFWLAGALGVLLAAAHWLSPDAGRVATIAVRILAAAGLAQLAWDAHVYLNGGGDDE
jgi:hypothetical protein